MRLKGGKYPGISADIDRSLVTWETLESVMTEEVELDQEDSFCNFDTKAALETEKVADCIQAATQHKN